MAFVSRTERALSQSPTHSPSLGPGAYLGQPQYKPNHGYAPFSSTTERPLGLKLPAHPTPGPGAYVAPLLSTKSAGNTDQFGRVKPTSSFASRQSRFKAHNNGAAPGPGAYVLDRSWSKPKKQPAKTESQQGNWLRLPSAPSIPAQNQAFGYDETDTGELIMQKNPEKGFAGTPKDCVGPGQYYTKAANEIWGKVGPAWDRSERKNLLLEPTSTSKDLGPGAYTPSKGPFNTKIRPNAVFQSGTKRASYIPIYGRERTLPEESVIEESTEDAVPGPGTYCGPDALSSFRLRCVPDKLQFFGSRVSRFRLKLMGNPGLGPGSYTPPPASKRSLSTKVPFATSDVRFQDREEELPGPGSYRARQFVEEIRSKVWGKQGIFGTTEKRFVNTIKRTPGPGYYPSEHRIGMNNSAVHKPLSVFQSRIKRELPIQKDLPAPGQYDLPSSFDLKSRPQRGRSQLAALVDSSEAGFSTRSPRFPTDSHSEERLGPGLYTPKLNQALRPVNRKNRALPQVEVYRQEERFRGREVAGTPGPGAYAEDSSEWNKRSYNVLFSDYVT